MLHPREKFKRFSILALVLSSLCIIITFFKFHLFFLFLASYLLASSMVCDALHLHLSFHMDLSIQQLIRGASLFAITSILLIYIIRL